MEIQLHQFIEQIKKDGVEAAEAEAKRIVEAAEAEAQKIIADAQAQADKLIANAKSENERIVRAGEDAIRQAGRNLLISFRESVARELLAVAGEGVADVYSSSALAEIIINVIEAYAKAPETDNVTVIMNQKDLDALEGVILAGVKQRMLCGVTLKASDGFDGGFRIAANNGSAYYDYSSEAVVEMLSGYLSPKVKQLMREA